MKILKSIERRRDGSLPRMSPRQKQAAVKLIREGCHNYDDGNCLILDSVCSQCITYSVNCKLFRRVLLEDVDGMKLKAELFEDETIKRCIVCGATFRSKSNNAKYCSDCAGTVKRKQKAAHARKRRSRVEKLG